MRVRLQTLGCRLNEAELESWASRLHVLGHGIATGPEGADLVVVNTCAVTGEAVRKSRKLLRRLQRENPRAKLVVSGCLASLEGEALAREQGVDLVVPNRDKDRLVEIAAEALALPSMPLNAMEAGANPLFLRERQRAFVKVQDGCRYRCTFCVVTLARGEERSRPISEVVDQVNRLTAGGIQEVVLTGVHLGGYGSDRGSGLTELIRALLADTGVSRLRMGSLEPWDLPEDLLDLMANPRLMPHLHLPLQSGSDRVLGRMARRCRTQELRRLAAEAKERVPDLNLTTDIIVGFPGETGDEWRETLDYVESLGFGHLHIFTYSPRAGTKAAALPGQVPVEIKRARSRELHALGRRLKLRTLESFAGRRVPVLVEGRFRGEPGGDWFGYTPNYLAVRIKPYDGEQPVNSILDISLDQVHPDGESLIGRF